MKSRRFGLASRIGVGVIALAFSSLLTVALAQGVDPVATSPLSTLTVPAELLSPPLPSRRVQFFKANPLAWNDFLAQLPRRPVGPPQATSPRALPASGGTWKSPCCTSFYPSNPRLLTDGTVIANAGSGNWYKLTPDINGSYVNGAWTPVASLPVTTGTQYAPTYFASAVLADGRVLIEGGEYNNGGADHTTLGAIYDPVANQWTAVSPPVGWTTIGDAPNVMLGNGVFLLSSCCEQLYASFDATALSWTKPGTLDFYPNEQGYELLPNGNVLTIDIWDNPNGGTTKTWEYLAASGIWVAGAPTPVGLSDCNWEMGPAVMRPDGTLVAFGGKSGCPSGASTVDPTAIYDSTNGTWSVGPVVPAVCGSNGASNCTLNDAPGALLPNGNILFAASAASGPPMHMFEFTPANTIVQVADPVYCASGEVAFEINFLVLPNGEILATDACNAPEFYTPTSRPEPAWAPVIGKAPSTIAAGATYPISGTQFAGLSQGAYYGDDVQGSTNYPLVRITNTATGHVFYARTFNHSTMSIEPGAAGATNFVAPVRIEVGASTLVVVANGIASAPINVTVTDSPNFAISASQLSFGNQPLDESSRAQVVTVTNTGAVTLSITSITLTGAGASQYSKTSTCGASLAVGAKCTISVVFKPTSDGAKLASVTVNGGGGSHAVAMTGTGIASTYTVSPTAIAFGSVLHGTTSAVHAVTVKNTGAAPLPITSLTLSGADAGQFAKSTTCGSSLLAGSSCTVSVSFKPIAKGAQAATLSINAGGGAGAKTLTLTGTGT